MLFFKAKNKTVLLVTLLIIAAIALTATLLLQNYRDSMMTERKEETRIHVVNGYELLAYYHKKAKKGELTNKQAKEYAAASIRAISPPDNKYYWINDDYPKMVMHADIPELDGSDLSNYTGPDGQLIFVEMTEIARTQGSGFIQYMWKKPATMDPEALYPKISYIKYYKPWGWIIGSGVYIDDINNAFWDAIYVVCGIGFAVILFMWVLGITVTESLKK